MHVGYPFALLVPLSTCYMCLTTQAWWFDWTFVYRAVSRSQLSASLDFNGHTRKQTHKCMFAITHTNTHTHTDTDTDTATLTNTHAETQCTAFHAWMQSLIITNYCVRPAIQARCFRERAGRRRAAGTTVWRSNGVRSRDGGLEGTEWDKDRER